MKVIARPSPNHDDRDGVAIDMLVLHYTGMRTAEAALEKLCDPVAKVSAHYTVDEDGTVYAHVPEDRRAWHAGRSFWGGATDINACSIGIELVNPGHEFGYREFPPVQIEALITLCQGILSRHAIPATRVLGHSDVAPARKEDPGELFPWARLAQAGIGLWPRAAASDLGPEALSRFGYDPNAPRDKVITAFQRHFRPEKLNGKWDTECAGLLADLLYKLSYPSVISRLMQAAPALTSMLEEHIRDNGEVLPHVFFGDVTRYVEAELLHENTATIKSIFVVLEDAISSPEASIRNIVQASFLENLELETVKSAALIGLAGPKIQAALRRERELRGL